MSQLEQPDLAGWNLRKDTDLCRVWTRAQGSEVNKAIPLARAEVYLPDVEDPRIIEAAVNRFRMDWDSNFSKYETLPEHAAPNSDVVVLASHDHYLIKAREFVDYRILFSLKTAI